MKHAYIIILFSIALVSCKKFFPDPEIPAYIQINSFEYFTNDTVDNSVSASSNIENVWVYADNEFIGVFVLPAKVPILKSGNVSLALRPGIKQNGISNTRVSYPFYRAYSETVTLTKGVTTLINPTTRYYGYTNLAYNEFFENNVVQLEQVTSGSGVNIVRTSSKTNDVFEGFDSGEIFLNGKDSFFYLKTQTAFPLPVGGRDVYLELDYKTAIPFDFGILSNSATGTTSTLIYTFNPTYDKNGVNIWKKIYIQMAPEVGSNANAIDYQLYFGGIQKSTDAAAHIFLDNIKIAHVKQ